MWLNLVRLYSLYKMLYPKGRTESYSIMGTMVSPNKIWELAIKHSRILMGSIGFRVYRGLGSRA